MLKRNAPRNLHIVHQWVFVRFWPIFITKLLNMGVITPLTMLKRLLVLHLVGHTQLLRQARIMALTQAGLKILFSKTISLIYMSKFIYCFSFLLAVLSISLMAFRGEIGTELSDKFIGLLIAVWPAFPICFLGMLEVFKKIPKIVTALVVFETLALFNLFFNVYFAHGSGSTAALGLVVIPLFILALNILVALCAYIFIKKKDN